MAAGTIMQGAGRASTTTRRAGAGAAVAALLLAGVLPWAPPAAAASVPVDLRTWVQEGVPANGDWTVAADGSSVLQSINGDPTFFVSPGDLAGVIRGKFRVETTSDDDMIGFVFGYRSPVKSEGDAVDDYDMFVLDWKQAAQNHLGFSAPEGLGLFHLRGTVPGQFTNFNNGAPIGNCFWAKSEAACPAALDVLATDVGTGKGWRDNTEYEFELVFTSTQIRVWLKGGTGPYQAGKVVFDVTGSFQGGRFGFYNFSQASVRYSSFTLNEAPLAIIAPVPVQECQAGGATVTLDGSSSRDPDGDPITFAWTAPGIAFDDPASATPTARFPLGTTRVTLVVSDGQARGTAQANVVVRDTQPPAVGMVRPVPGVLYVEDLALEIEHGLTTVPGLDLPLPIVAVGGLTVRADVVDQCGIVAVRFDAVGVPPAVLTAAPYAFLVDPPLLGLEPPGVAPLVDQRVVATATDLAGQEGRGEVSFLQVATAPVL